MRYLACEKYSCTFLSLHLQPQCFLFRFYMCGPSSIDALDAFVLRVKWRFEVGLGLVRHSHLLQGELAALYEIGTHLIKRQEERDEVKIRI